MANYRALAINALLADGVIDDAEVKVLKKELYADGKISHDEVKFLIELRTAAEKKAKARKEQVSDVFCRFFFKAMEDSLLDNGIISAKEANFLKTTLLSDGKVDDHEKAFLRRLKKGATKTAPEFDKLYEKHVGK